jgi:hypothetical protein
MKRILCVMLTGGVLLSATPPTVTLGQVPIPCDPVTCPPIDPCTINPDRCKDKGGPIEK